MLPASRRFLRVCWPALLGAGVLAGCERDRPVEPATEALSVAERSTPAPVRTAPPLGERCQRNLERAKEEIKPLLERAFVAGASWSEADDLQDLLEKNARLEFEDCMRRARLSEELGECRSAMAELVEEADLLVARSEELMEEKAQNNSRTSQESERAPMTAEEEQVNSAMQRNIDQQRAKREECERLLARVRQIAVTHR